MYTYAIHLRRKKIRSSVRYCPSMHMYYKHRYARVILLWIVQRRRRRYRSAKCRDRPCYYILYAEQLHSIISAVAVAAAAAVFTRLIISWKSRPRRLRPFIYLYFNFFSPSLAMGLAFWYTYSWRTSLSAVRNKLRSRDLKI